MDNLASLFNLEDVGKKDSKGKKKENVKEEKKGSVTKGTRFAMPVRIRSGHIHYTFEKENFSGKTLDEDTIKAKLRKEYPELSGLQFNLVKFTNKFTDELDQREKEAYSEIKEGDLNQAVLDFIPMPGDSEDEGNSLNFAEADTQENLEEIENEDSGMEEEEASGQKTETTFERGCWVKLEIHYQEILENQNLSFPFTVQSGVISIEIKEGTIQDIREHLVMMYPEYADCKFYYDEKNQFLIPYMIGESEIKGKSYNLPIKVGYQDIVEEYTGKDFNDEKKESVTWDEVKAVYGKKYPEFENCNFVYQEKPHQLFPVLAFKKELEKTKMVVPVIVRGSGFKLVFEKSDLKGKDAVTLEEVREALEELYPEYSKDRTEMLYDERGFVVPVLHGSRKGVQFISERKNQNFYMIDGKDGYRYRVEQMPFGHFECREDGEDVEFHMSDDKIPENLLIEILNFFRKEPEKEAAVQIFYDPESRSYKIHYPEQQATASRVSFERDWTLENEKVLAMDVHSHGCYPAFFSKMDNQDEKGTRLYLVFGNMNKKNHSCTLRAGIAGYYKKLELNDIFHVKKGWE